MSSSPHTRSQARNGNSDRSRDDAREGRRQQARGAVPVRGRTSRAVCASRARRAVAGRRRVGAGRVGARVRADDVSRGGLLVHVVKRVLQAAPNGLELHHNTAQ